jgi:hypothetical protein
MQAILVATCFGNGLAGRQERSAGQAAASGTSAIIESSPTGPRRTSARGRRIARWQPRPSGADGGMMLRSRKLLLSLAAMTAALAFAVPVMTASAATQPGAQSMLCTLLNQQLLFAGANSTLGHLLGTVLTLMHC